ncbi:nucleolar protein 5 [Gregarina niphandrodes]|uniref:Nucleolar protein 5 n=1 Tax=Gregarina niphandrodes TaxID=110365 RepID=A0A023BA85_GRENI|nr:nucleolar protein 5 [Gregarina niphandrodes]EZG78156.1 nucleolar protein 5 [Gregarina niphandrodes]|eukprot:XP_011129442.1 nucleolar protein 5 [Gregarina niphandrodes]
MVYLLAETPQGYGLFKMAKDSLLEVTPEDIRDRFKDAVSTKDSIRLESFRRFKDMKEATEEAIKIQEGAIGSVLKSFLKKSLRKKGDDVTLAVWDKVLAGNIKKKFDIQVVLSPTVHEIFRTVREYMSELVADLDDSTAMGMSLSHSLSRFKLKFSPEKVDVMIIQAVGLLEDLDKEANNLAMRLKEWYGFHFPELLKIVDSNQAFAKCVLKIGYRTNVKTVDSFNDCELSDEVETQLRNAAETSMGSDLVDEDLACINEVANRVLAIYQYREELTDYLKKRMEAIAPNLTYLVGEILGAKLLAQAGSLSGLAKQPASTVQILGAEKALFRALKTRSNTPKYGLVYHAKVVGQAPPKIKGKMSRVIANKIALCVRTDAYGEPTEPGVAVGAKAFCEKRLEQLGEEMANSGNVSFRKFATQHAQKYTPSRLRNKPDQA